MYKLHIHRKKTFDSKLDKLVRVRGTCGEGKALGWGWGVGRSGEGGGNRSSSYLFVALAVYMVNWAFKTNYLSTGVKSFKKTNLSQPFPANIGKRLPRPRHCSGPCSAVGETWPCMELCNPFRAAQGRLLRSPGAHKMERGGSRSNTDECDH